MKTASSCSAIVIGLGLSACVAEASIKPPPAKGKGLDAAVAQCMENAEREPLPAQPSKNMHACARRLRAYGQRGLTALWRRTAIKGGSLSDRPAVQMYLDAVAGQRDGWASGLFWYRDGKTAQAVARATNRPMISLRILGDLRQEYSCANSRFFRTLLYADPNVQAFLRTHFVLHWSSERPVPVVTVDYGDGRVLKKTITGNSIHYVLDSDGHVYDAMPGLVTPDTFVKWLREAKADFSKHEHDATTARGRNSHRTMRADRTVKTIERQWQAALTAVGVSRSAGPSVQPASQGQRINAAVAMPRALSKAMVEAPILERMEQVDAARLAALSDDEVLKKMAQKVRWFRLSDTTRSLMRRDQPNVGGWNFEKMAGDFVNSVKRDDVRNRFEMRHAVMKLVAGGVTEFDALNQRVYAEVMKTPRHDPWLGMHDETTYSGLSNGGLLKR